jgi:hypothetical protein
MAEWNQSTATTSAPRPAGYPCSPRNDRHRMPHPRDIIDRAKLKRIVGKGAYYGMGTVPLR